MYRERVKDRFDDLRHADQDTPQDAHTGWAEGSNTYNFVKIALLEDELAETPLNSQDI